MRIENSRESILVLLDPGADLGFSRGGGGGFSKNFDDFFFFFGRPN